MRLKIFPLILGLFLCMHSLHAAEPDLELQLKTGKVLVQKSKTKEALQVLESGLQAAKLEGNELYQGKFYLEAADVLLFQNHIDSIDSYYSKAKLIFEKFGASKELLRAKVGLLELQRRTNPSATMENYLQLLKEARGLKDNDIYYLVLDKIIMVNYGMENYKEAISQIHECISYYQSRGDSLSLAMKYRYLGNVYRTVNPDSSTYYYKLVLPYFARLQAHQLLVYTYVALGWSTYETDLPSAWRYLSAADSIDKKYNLQSTQLPLVISFALNKMGKNKEAIKQARKSLELGMHARQLFIGIQAADALKTYFKEENIIDSALHYAELSAMINDSIRSEKQYKDAGRMQAKLEYDRKLYENEIKQQEASKRTQLMVVFSFIAVGLMFAILFLIFRAYRMSKKANLVIQRQDNQKAILLQEIHHRVKNNLSIISGILDMQQRDISDPGLLSIFTDAKSRITSIALVHKNLYEHDNYAEIQVKEYLDNLYDTICDSYKSPALTVERQFVCNNLSINIDTLMPLALIVNELLTNSFKYAFNEKDQGHITLTLKKENKLYLMTYEDSGSGLSNQEKQSKGLGMRLIFGLTQQLNGHVEQINSKYGLKYEFSFEGL